MHDTTWVYDICDAIPPEIDEKITHILENKSANIYSSEIHIDQCPDADPAHLDTVMGIWDFLNTYGKLLGLKPFRPLELYYSLNPIAQATKGKEAGKPVNVTALRKFIFGR